MKYNLNPITGKLDMSEDAESLLKDATISAENVILTSEDPNLTDTDNVKAAIEKIATKVWYSKIAIQNLKVTDGGQPGTYEVGSTLSAPTLTWTTTKPPVKTTCDGKELYKTATTYTAADSISASKIISVSVTEAEGGTVTSSLYWYFYYSIYTGMATVPDSYTEYWVKNTVGGRKLVANAKGDYTMKGSTTAEYWWLVCPSAWSLKFVTKIGEGGAEKVAEIADFVNDAGKVVPMTVYRANQIQASDTKITVEP